MSRERLFVGVLDGHECTPTAYDTSVVCSHGATSLYFDLNQHVYSNLFHHKEDVVISFGIRYLEEAREVLKEVQVILYIMDFNDVVCFDMVRRTFPKAAIIALCPIEYQSLIEFWLPTIRGGHIRGLVSFGPPGRTGWLKRFGLPVFEVLPPICACHIDYTAQRAEDARWDLPEGWKEGVVVAKSIDLCGGFCPIEGLFVLHDALLSLGSGRRLFGYVDRGALDSERATWLRERCPIELLADFQLGRYFWGLRNCWAAFQYARYHTWGRPVLGAFPTPTIGTPMPLQVALWPRLVVHASSLFEDISRALVLVEHERDALTEWAQKAMREYTDIAAVRGRFDDFLRMVL